MRTVGAEAIARVALVGGASGISRLPATVLWLITPIGAVASYRSCK
jgi:hypothetical protein